MAAGDFRYKVGFYQKTVVPGVPDYGSGSGYPASATFTTFADIDPRLGGEQILAGRLVGKNFVNITVRQSALTRQVDTDWKAKDENGGTEYNIRSVIDPYQGDSKHGLYIEMLCEEGVAV